jgi:hypothetical protein
VRVDDSHAPSSSLAERHAVLRWRGRPDTPATITVRLHDRAARMRRAALAWLACWGCAVPALFLPGLHFVLVPLLVLGGPWLALTRMAEREQALRVHGRCPACGAARDEALRSALRPGMTLRCDDCRRAIEIVAG